MGRKLGLLIRTKARFYIENLRGLELGDELMGEECIGGYRVSIEGIFS